MRRQGDRNCLSQRYGHLPEPQWRLDADPFLKGMGKNPRFRYPSVTADLGYESEEDYTI